MGRTWRSFVGEVGEGDGVWEAVRVPATPTFSRYLFPVSPSRRTLRSASLSQSRKWSRYAPLPIRATPPPRASDSDPTCDAYSPSRAADGPLPQRADALSVPLASPFCLAEDMHFNIE